MTKMTAFQDTLLYWQFQINGLHTGPSRNFDTHGCSTVCMTVTDVEVDGKYCTECTSLMFCQVEILALYTALEGHQ